MDNIGLYIHIPFCDVKCDYCDFYSVCEKSEFNNYISHLFNIIELYSKKYIRTVDTIYFGGGTPSVLGTENLCAILKKIRECFFVCDDSEITLEVNTCSAMNLDFNKLRNVGFNRLSIGMQSSVDRELKQLSRRHTADDVRKTVQTARKCGFNNISLDLMICVPTQTKESLTESVRFCKDCDVEHISAYILKFEKGTKFYKNKNELDIFNDDEQAQMYLHVVNILEELGYKQYEVSNFSKPGYEGKHNLKYWRDEEYLGIGPSAHSFISGKRFYYDRSFKSFYHNETIDDGDGGGIEEYIMLKLRLTEGLSIDTLKDRYNFSPDKSFLNRVVQLKNQGLVEYDDNIIKLTKTGFLVSNSIINYLLAEI